MGQMYKCLDDKITHIETETNACSLEGFGFLEQIATQMNKYNNTLTKLAREVRPVGPRGPKGPHMWREAPHGARSAP